MAAVTNSKTADPLILYRRRQMHLAIDQGMMDAALAANFTTAQGLGLKPNALVADSPVDTSPIGGNNA